MICKDFVIFNITDYSLKTFYTFLLPFDIFHIDSEVRVDISDAITFKISINTISTIIYKNN